MKWLAKLLPRAVAQPAVRRVRRMVQAMRYFEMAKTGRLTASWTIGSASIDSEIYHGLNAMRARSRDLWANNEYMARWLSLLKNNVIGPRGVRLQMRVREDDGRPDEMANRLIEEAWADFTRMGQCDTTGKLSFTDCERLFLESASREGEALVRIVRGYDNPHGLAMQFLDPDRLDLNLNSGPGNNNGRVTMGVEKDEFGRPTAYYLLRQLPNASLVDVSSGQGRDRIEARDMIHAFVTARPEQTRGFPWAHAASVALHDLGGYREAAVVAARVGANKVGWFRSADGNSAPYDGVTPSGERQSASEPGEFGQLGPEDDIVTWDPSYPHDQFGAFNSAMLQGIAGALGVSYHALASDLSGVNFSAGRLGAAEDRDGWMAIQNWTIANFHARIFPIWLGIQLSTGRLNLPASRFDKFNRATWHPRRWQHIQPREQANADALMYGLNAKSLTEIIAQNGQRDREEVFSEIARERAEMERLGLTVTWPSTVQPADEEETMQ